MIQKILYKLPKQKGIPIYRYSADNLTLFYIFESKTHMYNSINIHHKTLDDCLALGTLYLDVFLLSSDLIEESTITNLISLNEIKNLVKDKRERYIVKHPASKAILAEFKDDSHYRKTLEFHSLNSLAKHLKGDRETIRKYLTGKKLGYYRGK